MDEPDHRALGGPAHGQPGPASHGAAHIHDVHAVAQLLDRLRARRVDDPDRVVRLRPQPAAGRLAHTGRPPPGVVEAGPGPAVGRPPRVVGLPGVQGVGQGRSLGDAPLGVRGDGGAGPVRVVDLQLCEQPGLAVPGGAVPVPHVGRGHAVEAAPEGDPDGVLTAPQQLRHVVDGVQHRLVVVGEAGVEDLVADAPSVDLRLVVGEPADVQAGARDTAADGEGAAQQRGGCLGGGDGDVRAPGSLAVGGQDGGRFPASVVEPRALPALPRRVRGAPAVAGAQFVGASVLGLDEETGEETARVDTGPGAVGGEGGDEDLAVGRAGLLRDVRGAAGAPAVGLPRCVEHLLPVDVEGEVVVRRGGHDGPLHHGARGQGERGAEPAFALRCVRGRRAGGPDPGGALQGRRGRRLLGADPARPPAVGRERGLPPAGLAPGGASSGGVPDPDLPVVAGTGPQHRTAVGDADAAVGCDPSRVPHRVGARAPADGVPGDPDVIGSLPGAVTGSGQLPGQPGEFDVRAEQVLGVLDAGAHDAESGPSLRPAARRAGSAHRGRAAGGQRGDAGGARGRHGAAEEDSAVPSPGCALGRFVGHVCPPLLVVPTQRERTARVTRVGCLDVRIDGE
ncbi:hypothetical protein STENM36S_05618 [Streptomyces tendae]